jgi:thioredoxin 1
MIELTADNFHDVTKEGVSFIDFYTDWCGPCKTLVPVIEDLSGDFENVAFGKINCEDEPELRAEYMVNSVPTMFVLKDGEVAEKLEGIKGKADISKAIQKVIDL